MITVDVYVPSLDNTFDFVLDENCPVSRIIEEMTEIISRQTGSSAAGNRDTFFLYKMQGELLLNGDDTLFSSGVRDGHRLLLV